ncbi:MAG TPA: TPM domain-containing protein [Casimicrobiaceae bacterium]|nr:TPM domain-containing protein [Casimicrobiaceae bacterium]
MNLSRSDADSIEARVREVESRTGAQIVTAVLRRSDSYPEIVWTAFALAVGLASVAVAVFDAMRPEWSGGNAALTNLVPVLFVGALSALATVVVAPYARLYLHKERAHAEVHQRAHSLFLDRRLTATRDRIGVLLLVSLFERQVVIVADLGFDGKLGPAEWNHVIRAMTPLLAQRNHATALLRGLDALELLLRERGFTQGSGRDELSNRPIDETSS